MVMQPIDEAVVRDNHHDSYAQCHCRFRGPMGALGLSPSSAHSLTVVLSFDAGVTTVTLPHDEVVRLKVHLDEWLTDNPF